MNARTIGQIREKGWAGIWGSRGVIFEIIRLTGPWRREVFAWTLISTARAARKREHHVTERRPCVA